MTMKMGIFQKFHLIMKLLSQGKSFVSFYNDFEQS